ncbi:putative origin recognition complex subunit 4 [Cladorrhinum sp. PSN259]|nr:putative origin recognition complex subunit 4 [Cladorrhinum sp. PSN259]
MVGRSNGTATGRKRGRPQNEDEPELSSTTTKKPRIKASQSLPNIVSASTTDGTSGPGRGRGHRVPAGKSNADRQEIADSDAERTSQTAKPPPPPSKRAPTATKQSKPLAATGTRKNSVYDFPDEDGLSTSKVTKQLKRTVSKKLAGPPAAVVTNTKENEAPVVVKNKGGRPRKHPLPPQDVAPPVNKLTPAEKPTKATPGRPSKARKSDQDAEPDAVAVSKTRGPGKKTAAANLRGGEAPAVPKGILTPRKGQGLGRGRRKNVVFDQKAKDSTPEDDEAEEALAAESPSKSSHKKLKKPEPEVEGEEDESSESEEEDDDDDEVCVICSKPDSEKGNEIVFCDNCDVAVHQDCYGIPEVPEGEWICRNCAHEEPAPAVSREKAISVSTTAKKDHQHPPIPNFEKHLRTMQRVLLDRCSGRRRIKLRGQDEAYDKAYQLVQQTIVAGEGNSMMIIGARGCGKTTLVESILEDVSREHKEEFHVVKLNGFVHTDDKLALREIWRQLGKEMEVEDELVNKTTNHADTMASLLALLSHPSEIAEANEGVTSKSIVFVIDEFDLFATHARQTLLYNLFDIAQARKAPIAVLGLTTRIDVVESLEKRVKSRFSHRYVYLSLPKSLPAYWDVCRQGLTIDDEDMEAEGIDAKLEGHAMYWKWWNGQLDLLYKSSSFQDHLESQYCSTKSVSAFLTTCILPLACLSANSTKLSIPIPCTGPIMSLEAPDSKLHMLESLSDLDLSLLIAAARLDIVAHTDTVNFAMAYDEYTSLMSKQRVQTASSGLLVMGGGTRVWGRGVAGMAWERLIGLGFLVPAAAGGRGTAGLGGLDSKMWKLDVALEEIPLAVKLNAVLSRWCSQI